MASRIHRSRYDLSLLILKVQLGGRDACRDSHKLLLVTGLRFLTPNYRVPESILQQHKPTLRQLTTREFSRQSRALHRQYKFSTDHDRTSPGTTRLGREIEQAVDNLGHATCPLKESAEQPALSKSRIGALPFAGELAWNPIWSLPIQRSSGRIPSRMVGLALRFLA